MKALPSVELFTKLLSHERISGKQEEPNNIVTYGDVFAKLAIFEFYVDAKCVSLTN